MQSTYEELRFWDLRTMTRIDTISIAHRGMGVLEDGTLVIFVQPEDSVYTQLHRIDAVNRSVDVLRGPILPIDRGTRVLPSGAPGEVWVTERDGALVLFRMHAHTTEERARVALREGAREMTSVASLGDGRLVARCRDLVCVLEAHRPVRRYVPAEPHVFHVAAASRGRVWYSSGSQSEVAESITLARIEEQLVPEVRISLASGLVIHLATGGGAVAVLVCTWTLVADVWSVVVFDDDGAERWRSEVPDEFARAAFDLDSDGFVAISERRVVLRRGDHALLAWDAATGQRVG